MALLLFSSSSPQSQDLIQVAQVNHTGKAETRLEKAHEQPLWSTACVDTGETAPHYLMCHQVVSLVCVRWYTSKRMRDWASSLSRWATIWLLMRKNKTLKKCYMLSLIIFMSLSSLWKLVKNFIASNSFPFSAWQQLLLQGTLFKRLFLLCTANFTKQKKSYVCSCRRFLVITALIESICIEPAQKNRSLL